MSRPLIGVVGSCNADLMVRVATLARPGETILGGDVARLPGGKGANQASAAARLGADVSLIASVGDDQVGDWLRSLLEANGVDVSALQKSTRPTGTAFITVDDRGENVIVVSPGANDDLTLDGVDVERFDVVLAQMEISQSLIDEASLRSRSFILNVAPATAVDSGSLARCAVVIANEFEAQSLDLASLERVVVTLGSKGAVQYRRGLEVSRAVAPKVEPVDTVGAGDVFCAAYAVQFARGASDDDALRFAVTAGSLATLAVGAQGALPTGEEVAAWLARA